MAKSPSVACPKYVIIFSYTGGMAFHAYWKLCSKMPPNGHGTTQQFFSNATTSFVGGQKQSAPRRIVARGNRREFKIQFNVEIN
jgi:hypothetical protein